jgi:hypothetical protein
MISSTNLPNRLYARSAGALYILIALMSIIAHGYVPETLIATQDAAQTFANIAADPGILRLGIGSELVILLSEIALTVMLYVMLRQVNLTIALIMVSARLIMTAIHGLNLLNHLLVLEVVGQPMYLDSFSRQQIEGLASFFLGAHDLGFTLGIVFLVPHVLALGYLLLRCGFVPRWVGGLIVLAGLCYLFDSLALLFNGYTDTPAPIAAIIALAEVTFPLWLLIRGIPSHFWEQPYSVKPNP